MNMADYLVSIIEKDGIVLADRQDVYGSLDKAIELGQFEFIMREGRNVGFFSWEICKPCDIFVNNLFIERKYRGTFSLMWGVMFLRAKYKEMGAFSWRSRKKNKLIRFKEKGSLCCSQ